VGIATASKFISIYSAAVWNNSVRCLIVASCPVQYAGDVNLTQVMAPWVYQMGLPVVTITESTTQPDHLVAEQIRFMNDPAANISEPVSPYK
jgi:hypothetical protein